MKYSRKDNMLTALLGEEVDFSNSTEVKQDIRDNLKESDTTLIIDLSDLKFIDSSGVGILISLLKTMTQRNGETYLVGPNSDIEFVLKMTKVDLIMPIFKSRYEFEKRQV